MVRGMDLGIGSTHKRMVLGQFGQHVSFLHSGAIKDGVEGFVERRRMFSFRCLS
jgi:hypothetical protein